MDELIDILDAEGKFTGEKKLKSYAHRMGLFHPTVHIWFYTRNREILIQQRGKTKDTHPLLWDVSVAGHVGAGEAIEIAAVREVKEEIGLEIKSGQLEKIGIFKSIQKHSQHLIDCEFHHAFIAKMKTPLLKLWKQDSEVENLALIPIDKFEKEVLGDIKTDKYVPHDTHYYQTIIRTIRKQL
jgi:isopentenyldiphosphate isomerase